MQVPFFIGLSKFITNAEQPKTKIMISGKYLYRSLSRKHHLNYDVQILRLLRLFSYLGEHCVVHQRTSHFKFLLWAFTFGLLVIFVSNETNFIGMHEIITMCKVYFSISKFDPCDLIDKLIAPCLHDLNRRIELRIKNPQENKPFIRDKVKWDSGDLRVSHCVILKGKLAV